MSLRTLVVDSDAHVRAVLGWLLAEDPRFELAGTAPTGDEAADWAGSLDAALVGLTVTGLDALETVRALKDGHTGVTIVVLAEVDVPYLRAAAAAAGAAGYLNRTVEPSALVDHLATICLGPPARRR